MAPASHDDTYVLSFVIWEEITGQIPGIRVPYARQREENIWLDIYRSGYENWKLLTEIPMRDYRGSRESRW